MKISASAIRLRLEMTHTIITLLYPASLPASRWAFVIPQGLLRREEPTTILANEFADLPMLRHLVSQTIMPSRETLRAAESARKMYPRLSFMCVHVNFKGILTGEATIAFGLQTAETTALVVITSAGVRPRVERVHA